jgi:drug/metabolite transporter, DME family
VLAAGLTAVMWALTGIFVRLLPAVSPLAVTPGRLLGAPIVALSIFATSSAKRSSLNEAIKNPVAYALAFLLAGYYLLATAAFQLAPVPEVAVLLSTPPLFVLALRRTALRTVETSSYTYFHVLRRSLSTCKLFKVLVSWPLTR